MIGKSVAVAGVVVGLLALSPAQAGDSVDNPPTDPFDYGYCGGKPMYPVIGLNFSTACGPRNQIALGRRGRLMWLYPSADETVRSRGERQLSQAELARLVFLAQAAQLAGRPPTGPARVQYDVGINFSGQANRKAHGSLDVSGDPDAIQALSAALRGLVPHEPLLPDCAVAIGDFSPTLLPRDRERSVK